MQAQQATATTPAPAPSPASATQGRPACLCVSCGAELTRWQSAPTVDGVLLCDDCWFDTVDPERIEEEHGCSAEAGNDDDDVPTSAELRAYEASALARAFQVAAMWN